MREFKVYNLEFPSGVRLLTICGYMFKAVSNYDDIVKLMPNYAVTTITGSHQITAVVKIPENEEDSVLSYNDSNLTRLYDVLFFISICTGRNVFLHNWEGELPIRVDYRPHNEYGGQLRLSVPYEDKAEIKGTRKIIDLKDTSGILPENLIYISLGFDSTIEKIISHISQKKWKTRYDDGYFLFSYYDMLKSENIETAFVKAFTVWESIFALENRKSTPFKKLCKVSGKDKIKFILKTYFNLEIDTQKIDQTLVYCRNRLSHFGKKTENLTYQDMVTFVQCTDQIITIILGLELNNTLNSIDKLEKMFTKNKKILYNKLMYNSPKIGSFYYHYKHDTNGPINHHAYEIINFGHHTEIEGLKESTMVIYAPLYKEAGVYTEGKHYDIRPLSMFLEKVEKDGQVFDRFTEITDEHIIYDLNIIKKEMYSIQ